MRCRPIVFAFVSAPLDTPALVTILAHLSFAVSGQRIGAKGATALAAVLKETQITKLG